MSLAQTSAVAKPDLATLKARQHSAWSSGDYALIGATLQIVGEELCEALDLRAGQHVLDVAAGNGNVSLAAARRWCHVTSSDYVPSLLARGKARAAANGLSITFQEADAEALPFADASFDVVASRKRRNSIRSSAKSSERSADRASVSRKAARRAGGYSRECRCEAAPSVTNAA